MQTTVSSKGQMVIPLPIREQARLGEGDTLDIGYVNGLVILRKPVPLTAARVRSLLASGADHGEFSEADETAVADAIRTVRQRRRR